MGTKITAICLLKCKKLEFWWVFDKQEKNFPLGRKHLGFKKIFWNSNYKK